MPMASIRKLILLSALFFFGSISAEFEPESLPETLATPLKNFLEADTGKARAGMAAFSDEDLQKITNGFKKSHSAADQRLFWLAEELYRRNAERVAAERIRYLYYAVIAALGIIALFSGLTYAAAKRRMRAPVTSSESPAAAPVAAVREKAPPKKNKPRKKGR
jgi:hypothetical protein